MSIETLEDSETNGQEESPIPELRRELESIIDSEARRRVEEYVRRLEEYMRETEEAAQAQYGDSPALFPEIPANLTTPDWHLGLKLRDDPIEFVIIACGEFCELAALEAPYKSDKEKIQKVENKIAYIKRRFTRSLNELKSAHQISCSNKGMSFFLQTEPIAEQDIDLIESVFDRARRWHEFSCYSEERVAPREKQKTPGRPAAEHVNDVEWRLWQVLQCAGMKRRMASRYIERLLSFYGLSERPWESIEQRLIKKEKSSSSL